MPNTANRNAENDVETSILGWQKVGGFGVTNVKGKNEDNLNVLQTD
jgi:hypothetical protein